MYRLCINMLSGGRLQQVVNSLKSGYDVSNLSIKKVRKAKGYFRAGAAAIMSRQLLEHSELSG